MTWRPRLPAGLLGTLLVVGTLGLAGALAWQAVQAAASHRAAVETTLSHHATTAAWHFAREARSWVGYGMNEAASGLTAALASARRLPGPELLEKVLAAKYCDCMSAAFGR